MIVHIDELVSAGRCSGDLPRLSVLHEDLGFGNPAFVFFPGTYNPHDFPRSKTLFVGSFVFIVLVFFGLEDQKVGSSERPSSIRSRFAAS